MKKIRISSELVYLLGLTVLSLAVAMISSTNFGVSMVVAPAYILSLKVSFLTFGQAEYIVQAIVFAAFCILMKKVKIVYFTSFLSGLLYGAVLDLWRVIIPHFNPNVTVPGSLDMTLKIVYFICGMILTAASVAILFKTYLYPQVYDFFVRGVSEKFGIDQTKFKICYDISSLAVSVIMTLVLFGTVKGIGIGTVIMAFVNGIIIGFFGKLYDKYFDFTPTFPKLAKHFDI